LPALGFTILFCGIFCLFCFFSFHGNGCSGSDEIKKRRDETLVKNNVLKNYVKINKRKETQQKAAPLTAENLATSRGAS
jgi:hypothetical protein